VFLSDFLAHFFLSIYCGSVSGGTLLAPAQFALYSTEARSFAELSTMFLVLHCNGFSFSGVPRRSCRCCD
jgi:hypothetical protein